MVFVVKALLVFAMAAFHFTIVPGRIRPNQFVPDMQLSGSGLEERQQMFLGRGKTVGKFKTVVSLNAFHMNTAPGKPFDSSFKKVGRRVGTLFRVCCQKT
jgi:hypothetical protein